MVDGFLWNYMYFNIDYVNISISMAFPSYSFDIFSQQIYNSCGYIDTMMGEDGLKKFCFLTSSINDTET